MFDLFFGFIKLKKEIHILKLSQTCLNIFQYLNQVADFKCKFK